MSIVAKLAITLSLFISLSTWAAIASFQMASRRRRMKERMAPIVALLTADAGLAEESYALTEATPQSPSKGANAVVARLNDRYPLAGGTRATVIAIIFGGVAFAVLVPLLGFFGMPSIFSFGISGLVGTMLAWNIGRVLEDRQRLLFSQRFLITIEDFYRMVRYGIPSQQALKSVAKVAGVPVHRSLQNIVHDMDCGVPIGVAMDAEAHRVHVSELSMLAAVLSTQAATGGNLSESVGNLADMVRERLDNLTTMKSSTAESRITLIILSLVPVLAIGLQAATQPELVQKLLGEGRHLLGIGVTLIVAGLVISWAIIRNAQR